MFAIPLGCVIAISAMPKVWILDFEHLPVKSPFEYRFTLNFTFADGSKDRTTQIASRGSSPDGVHTHVSAVLELAQAKWRMEEKGLTLRFISASGQPFRSIECIGEGAKPIVRWEFAPSSMKKK